jgi:hypothetical protein
MAALLLQTWSNLEGTDSNNNNNDSSEQQDQHQQMQSPPVDLLLLSWAIVILFTRTVYYHTADCEAETTEAEETTPLVGNDNRTAESNE